MTDQAKKSERTGKRINTPDLTPEEDRIVEEYRKKYRQHRGAALLLAAIPAMRADLQQDNGQRKAA